MTAGSAAREVAPALPMTWSRMIEPGRTPAVIRETSSDGAMVGSALSGARSHRVSRRPISCSTHGKASSRLP